MSVTNWVLYVDESGKIASRKDERDLDECNVTGVLVDRDRGHGVSESLEKQYQLLYPWVPWPFHHAEFKQPLYHVAWLSSHLAKQPVNDEPAFSKVADIAALNLARRLERAVPDAWTEFVKHSASNQRVDDKTRRTVQKEVDRTRENRSALGELRDLLARRALSMERATQSTMNEHVLYGFSAGETESGDAYNIVMDEMKKYGEDAIGPWGQMFLALIDRVILFLLAHDGEHHVEIVCANRSLWSGTGDRSEFMTRKSIERFLARTFDNPYVYAVDDETGATRVMLSVLQPIDFRTDANAFLVLADRLANEMREATKSVATLSGVHQQLKRRSSVVQLTHPLMNQMLPGICAVGEAERYATHLRENSSYTLSTKVRKRRKWPFTQAEQMAAASRTLELTWGLV